MPDTFTVFVWNDEELVVRYASSEKESRGIVADLCMELHRDDDPRWQWTKGSLNVTVRGPAPIEADTFTLSEARAAVRYRGLHDDPDTLTLSEARGLLRGYRG